MAEEFDRIKRLPPYVFSEVNRIKAELRSKGEDIIDFGMGNPDMPTPTHIIEKLKETVIKPGTGRYSVSRGIPGLRKAQSKYYKKRFNVDVDPEKEVIVNGKAYISEMSVEDQRHYAEDAGKSEEELAAITEVETTLSFEADGVLVKK